mgnify:CR=1 FL=1
MLMSFSQQVKSELLKIEYESTCCEKAMLYGMCIFGKTFSSYGVGIQTENKEIAVRYSKLVEMSDDYGDAVDKTTDLMRHFAKISNGLNTQMDEIKQSVALVNNSAEESTKGITEVTQRMMELSEAVSELNSQADDDKEISDDLSADVAKFKI